MGRYLIRYQTQTREPRLIGVQAQNVAAAISTCTNLPDFAVMLSVYAVPKIRYMIKSGEFLLAAPSNSSTDLMYTDTPTQAQWFYTIDKARSVIKALEGRTAEPLRVVAIDLNF